MYYSIIKVNKEFVAIVSIGKRRYRITAATKTAVKIAIKTLIEFNSPGLC